MKKYLRKISGWLLYPLYKIYQRKVRRWSRGDIHVQIFPGVFHPGFFFSTQFMVEYLATIALKDKKIHEPGAGSGFLSIYCAKAGGIVTASDINPVAVENIKKNAAINQVDLTVILSDLYQDIPAQQFDIIIINPPYFMKRPANLAEHAWFCGENAEYFYALFRNIRPFIHSETLILMVLSEDCRIDIITEIAETNGFYLHLQKVKKLIPEKNYIFSIRDKNINT